VTGFLPSAVRYLLAAVAVLPWIADPPPDDGLLFGEAFSLATGQAYTGDLIAVDSVVSLAEDSTLEGNIILVGGSLESAGRVDGDIACMGASLRLAATSVVNGNVACIGAVPEVEQGAYVSGSVKAVEGAWLPFSLTTDRTQAADSGRNGIGYAVTVVLFRMFLLSAASILIFLFFPSPVQQVAHTIVEKPAVSLVIGVLAMTAAVALFLLLTLTVCLSPVGLLGSTVLLVAVLMGWSALGWEIGRRLFGRTQTNVHPAVVAGTGTTVLTLAASALGYIPFLGLILIGLGLSFGLGAVVLTRFGGQEYLILPEKTPSDSITS
jgi:hypothetical protein